MLSITKTVSKKVNHPSQVKTDGKPVVVSREAKITTSFVDPKSPSALEDMLVDCAGDLEMVARVYNNGKWRVIQQWETNSLGKVDEVSKGVQGAIDGLVKAGLSAESARATIMANQELVAKLGAQKFEQFVDISIADFKVYSQKEVDGKTVSRYPDVTDIGEPEAGEEVEAEVK
jgi:hypothetical protein